MATKIRIKRGTSAQWAASTVPLAAGELGIDTTLGKIKFGNGTSLWPDLYFFHANMSDLTFVYDSAKAYTDLAVATLGSTSDTSYVLVSKVGVADGIATLDENGKIPDSEIPSGIARDTEVSTAASAAVDAAVAAAGTAADSKISTAIANLISSAPEALNTLDELAAALGDDSSYAATITTALALKAPIASPTFTGTVSGITKNMVGLGSVDNTADVSKPISTATQEALNLKLNISDQSFDYVITNSGTGGYVVNGVLNGNMYFVKGKKYSIKVNATGHPFWIQTVPGGYSAANVYSTGVTNGGTDNGIIIFDYSISGPSSLYYACQYHSSMQGAIIGSLENDTLIKVVSGSYTTIPADINKIIEMPDGGTVTISDSESFPVGCSIDILQTGSSQVTISGNGFTPNATPGLKLRTQWASATLLKRGLNSWVILGDLAV